MLNQGQGTYPQLAGSFFNSAQMMPHDNGRNAQQVPTFFGGLQNMMSASNAMTNYQGMPLSQNILGTQALAARSYNNALPGIIGGVGHGLGIASTVGSLGMMAGVGGGLAAGLAAPPLLLAGLLATATASAYKKRMSTVTDMRNALQGSRLGYGLADPVTGTISNQAAFDLSAQLKYSAAGSGFQDKDLTKVLGQASGLGMMNGMQSLTEVTKRVTSLAKASREIVMLGEGISMSDAMQLQKLTQDMGISTTKFRGKQIGKNLVMAARASNMSLDQATQIGGQGAITFQQLGLGAASGINAAMFSQIAAKGLTGAGAFSQRQLASLGGQQGIAQNLLAGQAGTMARLSDTLVMGAVKLDSEGKFRIDRDLLDRYVRGDATLKELTQRGKDIGKGMSKKERRRLLESLQFSMPELREQMSDMLNPEQMMTIQGREILSLREKTGLSMRRAAHAYFGDAAQAESFLGYAQNFRASRAEATRQRNIADQERMLKYAGMAKSSSAVSKVGRGLVGFTEDVTDAFMYGPELIGEYFADQTVKYQDEQSRGLRRVLGIGGNFSRGGPVDLNATVYGGTLEGRSILDFDRAGITASTAGRGLIKGKYSSYSDMIEQRLAGKTTYAARSRELDSLMKELNLEDGFNILGGDGAGQRLTEFEEGEYNYIRKIYGGDLLGFESPFQHSDIEKLQKIARITDEALLMGRATTNNQFRSGNEQMSVAYDQLVDHMRKVSLDAAEGGGTEGTRRIRDLTQTGLKVLKAADPIQGTLVGNLLGAVTPTGVNAGEIGYNRLKDILKDSNLTEEQKEAVIGQALRTFQKMEGEVGKGFNKMMTLTGNVAGILDIERTDTELDTLNLTGGAKIEARGLSKAIAESPMSEGDIQKLIKAFSDTSKSGLDIGDGGRDSTEAILRKAKIDRSRYAGRKMAGVRRLIDTLKGAQVTTKDKKSYSLADAFLQGLDRKTLTLGEGTVGGSARAEILRRMDALNDEMAGRYGEGAAHLQEDLQSIMTLDRSSDVHIKRARKELSFNRFMDSDAGRQVLETNASHIASQRSRDLIASQKKVKEELDTLKAKANLTPEETARLNRLQNQYEGLRYTSSTLRVTDEDRAKARDALFKAHETSEGITADEALDAYARNNRSLLSAGRETLSETLMELANRGGKTDKERQQRREAYSKLMKGKMGAELEFEFQQMRSSLAGIDDPTEKRKAESKMFEKIFKVARQSNVALPGMQQSKSLNSVLTSISEGIDEFKKAMQAVATITNNQGTLEIKLPAATKKTK